MEAENNKPITKFYPLNFLRISLFSHFSRYPCPLCQFRPSLSLAWIQKARFINQELIGTSYYLIFQFQCFQQPIFHVFQEKQFVLKCNLIVLSPYFKNPSMALDYLQDNYDFSPVLPKVPLPYLVSSHCSSSSATFMAQCLDSTGRYMSDEQFPVSLGFLSSFSSSYLLLLREL